MLHMVKRHLQRKTIMVNRILNSLVNALISLEKPCATKVAPDDKANSSGATFFSILPLG